MRMFLQAAGAALFMLASAPSLAADPPRAPTSKWVMDFGRSQCHATRDYGREGRSFLLSLKPSPMGQVMQLSLAVRSSRSRGTSQVPVEIAIDGGPRLRSSLLAFDGQRDRLRVLRVNLPLEAFAPLRAATRLSIEARGEIDESLTLTQMPALMAHMDRCVAGLRQVWNIEEAAQARLRTRAKGDLAKYFSNGDYPGVAMRADDSGTVEFALLVDETGKVVDCTVTATSNVPVLDAQSCAVLVTRAKLTPAVGADGNPARDAITGRIRWKIL